MENKKKVIIVGAGPGGLTAGLLLSAKGFDVEIYEKADAPGGRNASFNLNGFTFDIGPTFLMMKFILDEVFKTAGYDASDYLKFRELSPMYRLFFNNHSVDIYREKEKMKQELEKAYGKETADGLEKFYTKETQRYKYLMPCLQKDYSYFKRFFEKEFLASLPFLSLGKSLFSVLENYFKNPEARLCFTFQSKYLGMSPWQCPGAFGIIPFVEHQMGVWHVEGGLSRISEVMAKLVEEKGGKIFYNSPVKNVMKEGKKITAVELENGEKIYGDDFVVNADFAYSMANLFAGKTRKYTKEKLAKKQYSCSTFMIYLGLDKIYPNLQHHNIVFAKEYKKKVEEIFKGKFDADDFSIYARNACVNDKTLAPENCSQLYLLIPAPNLNLGKNVNWEALEEKIYRNALEILKSRLGLADIEKHIVAKKIISPENWQKDYNVYYGATFNLAHNLTQMLWFRPHNKLEGFENCYIAGGGTHPGSGLPTIYESGRISANMIINGNDI